MRFSKLPTFPVDNFVHKSPLTCISPRKRVNFRRLLKKYALFFCIKINDLIYCANYIDYIERMLDPHSDFVHKRLKGGLTDV